MRAQDGRTTVVDDLVLACSGPSSARLLDGLPGGAQQASAMRDVQFFPARLVLHTNPVYAPADPAHRAVWMPVETAMDLLAISGDRHFLRLALRRPSSQPSEPRGQSRS